MRSWTGIGLVVCGLGLGSVAMAGGIRLTGGIGDDSTRFAELGYRSTLMAPRPLAGNWDWSVPWEASIGYWRADHDKPGARSLGIAGIAPLLGLLGTVLGMIEIFSSFMGSGMANASMLASGIAKALITTAAGLMVAIPALFFHRYLQRRVDEEMARHPCHHRQHRLVAAASLAQPVDHVLAQRCAVARRRPDRLGHPAHRKGDPGGRGRLLMADHRIGAGRNQPPRRRPGPLQPQRPAARGRPGGVVLVGHQAQPDGPASQRCLRIPSGANRVISGGSASALKSEIFPNRSWCMIMTSV